MRKTSLVVAIAFLIGLFFIFDLPQFFSLDAIKTQQHLLNSYYQQHPVPFITGFFFFYVLVTALSLPGAALMTLLAGALFGLGVGTLVVSFASTLGATGAFLIARFLLRDVVERNFSDRLALIDEGIKREGAFYLFALRLVPIVPFFAINLVMGVTKFNPFTFAWVSQLGMLAGTMVYVNAGTQLAQLDSLQGIVSPSLLLSFGLLAAFPLLARRGLQILQRRRHYAPFPRPRTVDYNLIVIGAGAGGLVTAYIGAAVQAKVALIEAHKMGGDCLNFGCVPSKALIRIARLKDEIDRAAAFGLRCGTAEVDFPAVMQRVHGAIQAIEPHDSVERYTALGVEVVAGYAKITSPFTVEVNDRVLTTRNIVIATGAHPRVPEVPGLETAGFRTSDTLWERTTLPSRLVVWGGGPIGCELAQAFAQLGSEVVLIERNERLLPREDVEVSALLKAQFLALNIDLRLGHTVTAVAGTGETKQVTVSNGETLACDELLIALGRVPNVTGFGLEALGIPAPQTVETNAYLQTLFPNIYAVGDVAGPFQLTHAAAHQAWYAAVNALFAPIQYGADYRAVPHCTFTTPEVARVGLNERDAQAQGIAYEVTVYPLDDLDRAIADGETQGFVKVLTVPGRPKILGATVVAAHAGEMLTEFTQAMRHGLTLNQILSTIHPYPTWSEANKYAAGRWKQAHTSPKTLAWLAKFHGWRRGSRLWG